MRATAARVAGCRAAATIAGVGPRAWLHANAEAFRTTTADEIAEAFGGLVAPVDLAALRDGAAETVAATIRRGLAGLSRCDRRGARRARRIVTSSATAISVRHGAERTARSVS